MSSTELKQKELSRYDMAFKKYFEKTNLVAVQSQIVSYTDNERKDLLKYFINCQDFFKNRVYACFLEFTSSHDEVNEMFEILNKLVLGHTVTPKDIKHLPITDPRIYATILTDFYMIMKGYDIIDTRVFCFSPAWLPF